ncbi:hypothetical protein O7635_05360 [Asanoa sp. WMMD1127]|uniref:hypothetical protein n=1 Tax=Asanoa sp. WMMD1127 TaxID=3016107 RepID=UPI002417F3D2|nr:hypothetical protein [Asanoa sp. WMMD1127]MDG4821280.1 hypothetical protein [Asanoa sp. WMMD1127]
MAKRTLTVNLHITGARETIRAFGNLGKDANNELRAASLTLSRTLAARIQLAARREGGAAGLLARTVKARRDRVPVVVAGGSTRVGRHRTAAGRILFAAEFGANGRYGWYGRPRYRESDGRQFKPHSGQEGYWFFPTARAYQPEIDAEYNDTVDDLLRRWAA